MGSSGRIPMVLRPKDSVVGHAAFADFVANSCLKPEDAFQDRYACRLKQLTSILPASIVAVMKPSVWVTLLRCFSDYFIFLGTKLLISFFYELLWTDSSTMHVAVVPNECYESIHCTGNCCYSAVWERMSV